MLREVVKAVRADSFCLVAEVSEAILGWLKAEQVSDSDVQDDGDWISFIVPVSQAETMLHTRFHYYHNAAADRTMIRTLQYSIPQSLHGYVQMIQPTTRFGQMRPERSSIFDVFDVEADTPPTGYDPTFCNTTITPGCLRGLYGLDNFTAPYSGSKFGISGYLKQYARYDLLEEFLTVYAPYATSDNFTVVSINGGLNTQNSTSDTGEVRLAQSTADITPLHDRLTSIAG